MYRLSLDAGLTCPNRDGSIAYGGCRFCADRSRAFTPETELSLDRQLNFAKSLVAKKMKNCTDPAYIAYFQAGTNTYAALSVLEKLYRPLMDHPEIVGLAIATRPDCLAPDVISLLAELNRKKPLSIELGLQTIHERSARSFNRGYPYEVFEDAVLRLHEAGLETVVHLIFGLPGETKNDWLETVSTVTSLPISGLKLQVLNILQGTEMAADYLREPFPLPSESEWIDFICEILPQLPPGLVIHRLTGDGAKKDLIVPLWVADKRHVLNELHRVLRERTIQQGQAYGK